MKNQWRAAWQLGAGVQGEVGWYAALGRLRFSSSEKRALPSEIRGRKPAGMWARLLLLGGFALSGLGTIACGGAQFDGVKYKDDEVSFRLGPIPKDAREVRSDESKLAFQDDQAGATIAISARCGLDSDDTPLRALVQHLFLQLTDRKEIHEEEFMLDGRAAFQQELTAKLDGVSRHFLVTVLKKDGCVYDFLHIDGGGSDPRLVESRAEYKRMVLGFQTLE